MRLFLLFFFWHRVKGSTRVLPFGKPEWHVSTTEPDKETVKMVKEEWKEEGERGTEGGEVGMGLNERTKMWWLELSAVGGVVHIFLVIIKWFQFLILGQSLSKWCCWPGCHLKSLFMHNKKQNTFGVSKLLSEFGIKLTRKGIDACHYVLRSKVWSKFLIHQR